MINSWHRSGTANYDKDYMLQFINHCVFSIATIFFIKYNYYVVRDNISMNLINYSISSYNVYL